MKVGLVLEGGGMRGLYTAGVLDVMLDEHFVPDVLCGTSAGACFGINLPSKQRGRVLRYNLRFAGQQQYISLHSLITTGDMVNTDFTYHRLPEIEDVFDEATYEQSPTVVYATVTNCRTGKAEYMRVDDALAQRDVIRASASLPFISHKVRLGDDDYLDGGLVDNIPIRKAEEEGCDKIVVVLTRPRGVYVNDHLSLLSRVFYRHDKELRRVLSHRNADYRALVDRIDRLEAEGKIRVIRPSRLLKIGRLEDDRSRLQAMYDLGVEDARRQWAEIADWLRE